MVDPVAQSKPLRKIGAGRTNFLITLNQQANHFRAASPSTAMQSTDRQDDVISDSGFSIISLPFIPDYQLHIGLFADLQNAPFLRQQLLSGNSDFEYAFIDATSIISTRHVLAACFRAINDSNNNRLRSRNVHSEIVYSLNSNNNVNEIISAPASPY